MPTYEYRCSNCEHTLEIYQSFHDDPLQKCPACNRKKLERVIFSPHVHIVGEPSSLGQLASRNAKKLGHYEKESLDNQKKERKSNLEETKSKLPGTKKVPTGERPWWRRDRDVPDKSLTRLTKEQKHTYITTGKR